MRDTDDGAALLLLLLLLSPRSRIAAAAAVGRRFVAPVADVDPPAGAAPRYALVGSPVAGGGGGEGIGAVGGEGPVDRVVRGEVRLVRVVVGGPEERNELVTEGGSGGRVGVQSVGGHCSPGLTTLREAGRGGKGRWNNEGRRQKEPVTPIAGRDGEPILLLQGR